jgi:hypothetical protein
MGSNHRAIYASNRVVCLAYCMSLFNIPAVHLNTLGIELLIKLVIEDSMIKGW